MSRTPKIRFAGFTGDWERKKWENSIDISTEMVNPASGEYDNMPHIAPGNIESFTGQILDNVKTVREEQLVSGKFRFRPGDIVYGKIRPQLGKYFYADVNGLTSADAYVLKAKDEIAQEFLFSLLQTNNFFRYSVSVSMRSGMPKINRDELNVYRFMAPSKEEQILIGRFMLKIGKAITLQQRKVEKLKQIKKAMLEKMLPKDGALVPDIRFAGFTGDWGRRRFGDILFTLPYKPYLAVPKQNGCYKVIQQGTNPIVGYATGIPCSDFKDVVIFGDHTLSLYKPNSPFFVATDGVRILKGINGINGNYLYVLLERYKLKNEGYKRYYSILAETECKYVADTFEQEAIGNFFVLLDKSIILQQRKVEKLQQLKKALLEKMFV